MKNLKKITISSSNAYYMVQDNVLYGKNGALMQYPIGSKATSFSVPASVSGVTIKHIDSHAFFNAKNLREVSLNNVMTIGLYAFTGCTNLTTLTNASNVELVLDCAFDGTPIANQDQDFITIGKVLYKYNGTHSVLESSDFPTGLERISVSAFCNKENLTEVHLPLSIYGIDNCAFVNCPNLEKMVFLNGVLPKVGEFSFTGLPDSFKFYCRKSLIDRVDSSSTWYSQLYRLEPIATRVYFEDIDLYETFYYGDYITPPKDKIEGKYNKGWLRVDEETNQTYGNYLTPIQWRETVATATYRADLILLSSYAIGVFNGEKQIGAVHISIGDRYEFRKTECIINDVTYTFANPAAMSNCYHNGYYGPSVVNGTTIAYFNGWTLFGNKISSGQWFEYYNDGVLFIYSDWDVVEFTATAYDGYSGGYSTYKFNYCDGLNLADPVRSGYKFKGWKNNNTNTIVSMPLRVESNVSLTAQWVRVYSISYQNLTFQGKTADVVLGDRATDEVKEYEYGKGLDMSNVFAAWRSGSPYSPQLRFLGWFTDKNLTTPATNISATATGAKTFYAKWRFDQTNSSRHGTYSINNSDPLNQNRDQMYVGLNNNNLGNDLKALGIKTLVVKFWIKIKGTGTASIYLYNGNTKIQTQTISGFSNDEYSVKECKFVVSLSAIENAKFLDIRYQASTSGWWIFSSSDNWQSESIYYEQCYVVNESDVNSPDFFWHYQFPY
ncbi:MAG: leucine-rich repeat domain-containing protein [Candidatus Borkfalkiaceae bacterium]|nr:leucine-rich repeat domain-containing protein [Christensenellaceae bacterium]